MFSWAVSSFLVCQFGLTPDKIGAMPDQAKLMNEQASIWSSIAPSIILLRTGQNVIGNAACIDRSGLFLTHGTSSLSAGLRLNGTDSHGDHFYLRVIAIDEATDLVLLETQYNRNSWVPVRYPSEIVVRDRLLIAALPSGPVRSVLAANDILAVMGPAKQAVTLNEIRFDAPAQLLSGALLFDGKGQLVGVLGATLPSKPEANGTLNIAASADRMVGGSFAEKSTANYGPSGLTVAYALSPLILSRVIEGFRSPTHVVDHPTLGISTIDALNRLHQPVGELIMIVKPGSVAEQSGLRKGDIVTEIDGMRVKTHLDYARKILAKRVGDDIRLTIVRANSSLMINVKMGRLVTPKIRPLPSLPPK